MSNSDGTKRGRPAAGPNKLIRVTAFLNQAQIDQCNSLGNGNLAEGIRLAIAAGMWAILDREAPLAPVGPRVVPRRRHQ